MGAQYGDEGKGKIAYALSPAYNWVIRFNGGPNAGHTVYDKTVSDKPIIYHSVPAVNFGTDTCAFIGYGCVVDIKKLIQEVEALETIWPGKVASKLFIDSRATAIDSSHILHDCNNNLIGTTGSGIGPAYADRCYRTAFTVGHLDKYPNIIPEYQTLKGMGVRLLQPTSFSAGRILFEGAQGVMLDLYRGNYPYVTSSFCGIEGICGYIHPRNVTIMGVMKPYLTRVGSGRMDSEMTPELADEFRSHFNEYGATTGRPRRIGWLNKIELLDAQTMFHFDCYAVTKTDLYNPNWYYQHLDNCVKFNEDSMAQWVEKNLARPVSIVSNGPDASAITIGDFPSE